MALVAAILSAGTGLLLYTTLDIESVRRVSAIMRSVECDLVFVGADDEEVLLTERMAAFAHPGVPAMVARGLLPYIGLLPSAIRTATMGLFGWSPLPANVEELAERAHSRVRRVQRHFAEVKLTSPDRLIRVATVARLWYPLKSDRSIGLIARLARCDSSLQFRRVFRRVVGIAPSSARYTIDETSMAERLLTHSIRGGNL